MAVAACGDAGGTAGDVSGPSSHDLTRMSGAIEADVDSRLGRQVTLGCGGSEVLSGPATVGEQDSSSCLWQDGSAHGKLSITVTSVSGGQATYHYVLEP